MKILFKNHKYLFEKSGRSSVDELKKWGYGGGAPRKIFDVFRSKKNELSAQTLTNLRMDHMAEALQPQKYYAAEEFRNRC